MRAGQAWKDITPDRPLDLMGQMHVRKGETTRDPLTVNAAVFEEGQSRVALVSVDVCYLGEALTRRMRQACAKASGLAERDVIIAATHTHVAPCTSDEIVGELDPAWIDRLVDDTAGVVTEAVDDLEDAEIFAGAGWIEQMGWNRRGFNRDGGVHMYHGSWNEGFAGIEGPRDGHVPVIFARGGDGHVKLVVTGFATHPNSVESERFYSADVPGEVRRVLRGALGPNVGVVYLSGASGDTAPSIMVDNKANRQPWRGEHGVRRSGWYLGGEILKVMAEAIDPMPEPRLAHVFEDVAIPMREPEPYDETVFSAGMREFIRRSRELWPRLAAEDNPVANPVHVVRIGDAVICTNPAELYCAFGLAIQAGSPARVTMIAQLADGCVGYVPTPEAIRHGGYSAAAMKHCRLVPDAGWRIVDATQRMLADVFV